MANPENISKKEALDKKEKPGAEERGKKAIEAHNKLNKQDKTLQQQQEEESKDAEQWRNEG
jgi:hypothetical protein